MQILSNAQVPMAEQISHKKSLRVTRLNKDRRLLLKEYYKLEEEAKENQHQPPSQEVKEPNDESNTPSNTDIEDKPINERPFKELVQIHNKLLKKETETNNSIKNTIYENYYDLIKVNDLLKEITHANDPQLAQLKDTIDILLQ